MKIHTLWVDREGYPELVTAWDEFCVDGYYEGWEKEKEEALDSLPEEIKKTAVELELKVDDEKLFDAVLNNETIQAELTEGE